MSQKKNVMYRKWRRGRRKGEGRGEGRGEEKRERGEKKRRGKKEGVGLQVGKVNVAKCLQLVVLGRGLREFVVLAISFFVNLKFFQNEKL